MSACLFVGGVADDGVLEWHIPKPLAPVMCDVRDERAFEVSPGDIYRRVGERLFTCLSRQELWVRLCECYQPQGVPRKLYRRALCAATLACMRVYGERSATWKAMEGEVRRLEREEVRCYEDAEEIARIKDEWIEGRAAGDKFVPQTGGGEPPRCCPYCGRAEKVGQVLLSCGACGGLACAECVARCCTPGCPEPRESFDPNQPNTETP